METTNFSKHSYAYQYRDQPCTNGNIANAKGLTQFSCYHGQIFHKRGMENNHGNMTHDGKQICFLTVRWAKLLSFTRRNYRYQGPQLVMKITEVSLSSLFTPDVKFSLCWFGPSYLIENPIAVVNLVQIAKSLEALVQQRTTQAVQEWTQPSTSICTSTVNQVGIRNIKRLS